MLGFGCDSNVFFLGPLMKGGKEYDKHCVFGNDVEMSADQVAYLTDLVAGYKPFIPYYVYKTTDSNVIPGKAKMVDI